MNRHLTRSPAPLRGRNRRRLSDRRGAIVVLAAVMSVVLLGVVAFAVDVGYVLSSKQELQRTADAAAMAACWNYGAKLADGYQVCTALDAGRQAANRYASLNDVAGEGPELVQNSCGGATGDVVFGAVANLYDANFQLDTSNSAMFNAVKVRVRRDSQVNGQVPFFFAKVFGRTGQDVDAEATAGYARRISGFKTPGD
ncbi:MAG: hypothetical protein KDA61_22455, partial [Planctomycetales bacterium]|nr:hypothetical protein [Planctomycetales bacterium]